MKPSRYQPYHNRARITNFDRHCQSCGVAIKGAAHQKPCKFSYYISIHMCIFEVFLIYLVSIVSCFKCKAPQDGRHGWMECGWGRCADCDSWMHKDHSYCLCGFANQEAIERRRLQQEASRQQEENRRRTEVRQLREELARAEREKMQLQQRIDEREADDALAAIGDVDLN
ncbi:unnamed protein product [Orchesella dallaii]|uniref:Uncharacterized protein n=1 Tax=Orchesella dallaii TaxID=48710 RepID=A0ABP1RV83_9HEXA